MVVSGEEHLKKNIQKERSTFLSSKPGRNKAKTSAEELVPWLSHATELYGAYNMEENLPYTETTEHTQTHFKPLLPYGYTPELKGFVYQSITVNQFDRLLKDFT